MIKFFTLFTILIIIVGLSVFLYNATSNRLARKIRSVIQFFLESFTAVIVVSVLTAVFIFVLKPLAIKVSRIDTTSEIHDGHIPLTGGISIFCNLFDFGDFQ